MLRPDAQDDLPEEEEDDLSEEDEADLLALEENELDEVETEREEEGMTLLRGIVCLLLTLWTGWEGLQHGRLYGTVDLTSPQELKVAYVSVKRDFWDTSAILFGTLPGSKERVRVELFHQQGEAFFPGDTAIVYRSPGCDCLVTSQQVDASGPFHRIGDTIWSWQGMAAVALGLYSLLLLTMGGLGLLQTYQSLTFRLRLTHEIAVAIFTIAVSLIGLVSCWAIVEFTATTGERFAAINPEKTVELTVTGSKAWHGWVRKRFSGQARAADGRTFDIPLSKYEFLSLRIGGPLDALLVDGGKNAVVPQDVEGVQPIVKLFGRPFTFHIFLTPLTWIVVGVFLLLAVRQVRTIRTMLVWRRIWREAMERRYAGFDRSLWPGGP